MPRFIYKAKEGPTKVVEGVIDAENVDNAIQRVIQKGLTPLDVVKAVQENEASEKSSSNIGFSLIKKVSLSDVSNFTRQISDLIDASVPILRVLYIVSNQTKNKHFQEIILQMHLEVKDGGSFANALSAHKDIFSPLYINMIRTGELSGQLPVIVGRLADYLEKEQETKGKVRSSLAYPTVILIVGILTIFVLLTFVVPRMAVMFEDLDQELPLPTVILTNLSGFFAQYWWLMIGVLVVSGVYLKRWLSFPRGRLWFDMFKIKIPVLGQFFITVEVGRFARTLGTLLESGIPITNALNSVSSTIENTALQGEIKQIAEDVSSGSSLKAALKQSVLFPEMAVSMISVGEETGKLEKGLYKIADNFERQSEQSVKTFISLLGPIVLVGIVSLVGFFMIAMLLPVLQMNMLIQ